MKYDLLMFKSCVSKKYIKNTIIILIVFAFNLYFGIKNIKYFGNDVIYEIIGFNSLIDSNILSLIYKIINVLFICLCVEYIYLYDIDYNSSEILLRFGKTRWSRKKSIFTCILIVIVKVLIYLSILLFFNDLLTIKLIIKDLLLTIVISLLLISYLNIKLNNNKLNCIFLISLIILLIFYFLTNKLIKLDLIYYIVAPLILIILKELSLRYESQKD